MQINYEENEDYLEDMNEIRELGSKPTVTIAAIVSKDEWLPDDSLQNCLICSSVFTTTKRRHHCRFCGLLICSSCTSKSLDFNLGKTTQPARICDGCRALLSNDSNTEKIPGIMDVAIREGLYSPDEEYDVAKQKRYAGVYFVNLVHDFSKYISVADPNNEIEENETTNQTNFKIQRLSLQTLIKLTYNNERNQEIIRTTPNIFDTLFTVAFSHHQSKHLALELLANISITTISNDLFDPNLRLLSQMKKIPNFILNCKDETAQKPSIRFLYNYLQFCLDERLEFIEEAEFSFLLRIVSVYKTQNPVLTTLALGSISIILSNKKLQHFMISTGGIGLIFQILSDFIHSETRIPLSCLFFATKILWDLVENDENVDSILIYDIRPLLRIVLEVPNAPQIIHHVLNFIMGVSKFPSIEKRFSEDACLVPVIFAIFQPKFPKATKLKALKVVSKLANFVHLKKFLIENQFINFLTVLSSSNDSGIQRLAAEAIQELKK
ncbi:zinc finger fyve domain-containing protein [Anaeramoeba ignava]|uniref:Zinc finger fyve domain-containing protein n=1 Tax=Anaeramoeba ignava TaxID=1746090 RepID=A0A9Q0LWP0_ANAIG|nr:zinc finger fyve domain-containing protein [Anaeramoeba ignava]